MPKGSGLTKPLQLSTELADLVGAKKGEKLSRPEVVKRLWAHIKSQKLQDPKNCKIIFFILQRPVRLFRNCLHPRSNHCSRP